MSRNKAVLAQSLYIRQQLLIQLQRCFKTVEIDEYPLAKFIGYLQ